LSASCDRMDSMSAMLDTPQLRQARGAFFRSDARFVSERAVRESADRVPEPSCGEASLLHAVHKQLTKLDRGEPAPDVRLHGVELHKASRPESQTRARRIRTADGHQSRRIPRDRPSPALRHRDCQSALHRVSNLAGEPRARPRAASLQSGVALSGLVSSWAACTVHSALFLKRKRTLAKRGARWTASMMPQDGMEARSEVGSTGMLTTEPQESGNLLVSAPAAGKECAAGLARIRDRVMRRLQAGELAQAACVVDELLLIEGLRMRPASMDALHRARVEFSGRRTARSLGVPDE
jgi:hypothetical protein